MSSQDKNGTFRRLLLSALALALALGAFLIWQGRTQPSSASPPPDHSAAVALEQEDRLHAVVASADREYRQAHGVTTPVADPRRLVHELGESREQLAEHYRTYFRYPHHSRPLNEGMASLLDPLSLKTEPVPVFDESTTSASEQKPRYHVQFFGSQQAISAGEAFQATLKVTDAGTGTVVKPTILNSRVRSDTKTGRIELSASVAHSDDGTLGDTVAGDGIYTFRWQPPAKSRIYSGDLSLEVALLIGESDVVHSVQFSCTPLEPARFTGRFEESIERGSLVVVPEVEVFEPGSYLIEASLYHVETGTPIGWSRNVVNLSRRTEPVRFLFFGKIFHDKGLEGKFALRHLRGYRINRPYDPAAMIDRDRFMAEQRSLGDGERRRVLEILDAPIHQYMASWKDDYETRNYDLFQFSSAEYDGADKRQVLADLEI